MWTVDDTRKQPVGLLGMDLVRLTLERSQSADEALTVLTDLLEVHGQGGSGEPDRDRPYFSSFLIAAPDGGWVVETSARGTCVDVPPVYDSNRIRAIRRLLAFSQHVFAEALNVSVQTVRAWEQGTRTPDGPTLRLLEIAEEHPEVIRAKVHRLAQVPR